MARKTKNKKLKLIVDYEASGLSMSEQCNGNAISTSAFAEWIRSTREDMCLH